MTEKKTDLQKLADSTNGKYSPSQVATIKNTVAKGTSDVELAHFLQVCVHTELDPFMKEIWCYKDHRNNVIIFAGRDGFLKKAQAHDDWQGMSSSEVRQNDEFVADIPNGVIKHTFGFKERGPVVGAYAIVHRKNISVPTIAVVRLDDYDKKKFVWDTHKADMIIKTAEVRALKKAFSINGLQSETEWHVDKGGRVEPIATEVIDVGGKSVKLNKEKSGKAKSAVSEVIERQQKKETPKKKKEEEEEEVVEVELFDEPEEVEDDDN